MQYGLKYINVMGEFIQFGGRANTFVDTVATIEASEKHPSYSLIKFEGFGEVGADVQLQKAPYQDGSTHIDTMLDNRHPYIEFVIRADNYDQLSIYRKHVSKVFNPKVSGKIELLIGDKTYFIDAIPEHAPNFTDDGSDAVGKVQIASLNLICPNPYWQSETITEEPTFEALFVFPFEGEFEMGIQRDRRTIINDGDAPSPIQIEFYGPAVNPIVRNNTTGEFIKVNQTLYEGEYMKIDTTPGQKSVFFVAPDGTERNVFNWIDLESEFFQLQLGENDIEYSADSDIQGGIFNIYYSKNYVGV